MSIDETRKFISGKPTELKAKLDEMERKGDPVKIQSQNLADEMLELEKGMRAYRRPLENTLIDLNNSFRDGFKSTKQFTRGLDEFANSVGVSFLSKLGLVKERAGVFEETSKMKGAQTYARDRDWETI